MKLYTSWFVFAGAPRAMHRYFERRRATSLARLAAVTRELRDAMQPRAASGEAYARIRIS
ncbi:hypothetical protein EJV46_09370 [Roseococcus sp. SYP-B2431]|uniref:hypothetical protein n=1 Tax=Roseococcus sp. SYP-B2431 TaxID=2496640 RepID=UPI00103A8EAF|nr:hypothetical protein [Roseococcus sp. SYP-B2431]TCH98766.1 hypothetical protein EJV46_09370 [Roseococcus sp. SYP-B2431]